MTHCSVGSTHGKTSQHNDRPAVVRCVGRKSAAPSASGAAEGAALFRPTFHPTLRTAIRLAVAWVSPFAGQYTPAAQARPLVPSQRGGRSLSSPYFRCGPRPSLQFVHPPRPTLSARYPASSDAAPIPPRPPRRAAQSQHRVHVAAVHRHMHDHRHSDRRRSCRVAEPARSRLAQLRGQPAQHQPGPGRTSRPGDTGRGSGPYQHGGVRRRPRGAGCRRLPAQDDRPARTRNAGRQAGRPALHQRRDDDQRGWRPDQLLPLLADPMGERRRSRLFPGDARRSQAATLRQHPSAQSWRRYMDVLSRAPRAHPRRPFRWPTARCDRPEVFRGLLPQRLAGCGQCDLADARRWRIAGTLSAGGGDRFRLPNGWPARVGRRHARRDP